MTLTPIFLQILRMSGAASVAAVCVATVFLCLSRTRAPKRLFCLLWLAVAFRMLCPVTFAAPFSPAGLPLLREASERYELSGGYADGFMTAVEGTAEYSAAVEAGVEPERVAVDGNVFTVVNYDRDDATGEPVPATRFEDSRLASALSVVWLCGVGALLGWSALSLLLLRRRLRFATLAEGNVWECEAIDSPFVLGFYRPRIYLPAGLDGERRRHILAHERAHIKNGDHLLRPLYYFAQCLHWFNPLLWLMLRAVREFMEQAADEKALSELGESAAADYARTLLDFSERGAPLAAGPLAFGESATKDRLKRILKFKRPKTWLTALAAALCLLVATACAAAPAEAPSATAPEAETTPVSQTAAPEPSPGPAEPAVLGVYVNADGASLYLGMAASEAEQALGVELVDGWLLQRGTYSTAGVMTANGVLSLISVNSDDWRTAEGIGLGATREEVVELYGEPDSADEFSLEYSVDGDSVHFFFGEDGALSMMSAEARDYVRYVLGPMAYAGIGTGDGSVPERNTPEDSFLRVSYAGEGAFKLTATDADGASQVLLEQTGPFVLQIPAPEFERARLDVEAEPDGEWSVAAMYPNGASPEKYLGAVIPARSVVLSYYGTPLADMAFSVGKELELEANVYPEGAGAAPVWSSSDESVLTVSVSEDGLSGVLTGVDTGVATLTVTAGDKAICECVVRVR